MNRRDFLAASAAALGCAGKAMATPSSPNILILLADDLGACARNASNCAWGAGFRNLYVTARTSVYRIETKVNGTRTY
jgi:hypothetical protein